MKTQLIVAAAALATSCVFASDVETSKPAAPSLSRKSFVKASAPAESKPAVEVADASESSMDVSEQKFESSTYDSENSQNSDEMVLELSFDFDDLKTEDLEGTEEPLDAETEAAIEAAKTAIRAKNPKATDDEVEAGAVAEVLARAALEAVAAALPTEEEMQKVEEELKKVEAELAKIDEESKATEAKLKQEYEAVPESDRAALKEAAERLAAIRAKHAEVVSKKTSEVLETVVEVAEALEDLSESQAEQAAEEVREQLEEAAKKAKEEIEADADAVESDYKLWAARYQDALKAVESKMPTQTAMKAELQAAIDQLVAEAKKAEEELKAAAAAGKPEVEAAAEETKPFEASEQPVEEEEIESSVEEIEKEEEKESQHAFWTRRLDEALAEVDGKTAAKKAEAEAETKPERVLPAGIEVM